MPPTLLATSQAHSKHQMLLSLNVSPKSQYLKCGGSLLLGSKMSCCIKHKVWLLDGTALPTQIRLGVHPVESPRRPGELSLVAEPVHGVRKGGA